MRKQIFDVTVVPGTPFVSNDLDCSSGVLVVLPVSGGTALVEEFHVRTAGVPADLRTMTAQDASTMSAVAFAGALATKTSRIAPPGVRGIKITATTQNVRAVFSGSDGA